MALCALMLVSAPLPARAGDPLDGLDGTEAWSRVGRGDAHASREAQKRKQTLRALAEREQLQESWETERLELRNERRSLEAVLQSRQRTYVEQGLDIIVRDDARDTRNELEAAPRQPEPRAQPAPAPGRSAPAQPAPAQPAPSRATPASGPQGPSPAEPEVPDWMAEEARRLEQKAGAWLVEDEGGPDGTVDAGAAAAVDARAEAEARRNAAAERRRQEEARRLQAEQEARRRAAAEAAARLERERRASEAARGAEQRAAEAALDAERRAAEAALDAERVRLETVARQQEDDRRRADADARRRAEDEARRAAEARDRQRAEDAARAQAEEAARRKAEEDRRNREEAARKAAERIGGSLDSEGQFVDPDLDAEFEDLADDDF